MMVSGVILEKRINNYMKYKKSKCLICRKRDILKDDICVECDGGDKFVNELFKFLIGAKTEPLFEKEYRKLISLSNFYETNDWVRITPITYEHHQVEGWRFKVTMAKEK